MKCIFVYIGNIRQNLSIGTLIKDFEGERRTEFWGMLKVADRGCCNKGSPHLQLSEVGTPVPPIGTKFYGIGKLHKAASAVLPPPFQNLCTGFFT